MTSNNEEIPVLFLYFEKSSNILIANYARSGLQKASDNLGSNREDFCELFLQKVLPTRLSYRKEEIWDSRGGDQGIIKKTL